MPGEQSAVLVTSSYPPAVCGVGDYTACLAHHLRIGDDALLTVWTRARDGLSPDARAVADTFDAAGVRRLMETVRREHPALVHLQYEAALYAPSVARLAGVCRRAGVPLVTTLHALDGPRAWGRAHRLALAPLLLESRALVVCSGRQFAALSRLPGVRSKTHRVPVGSTVPPCGPAPERGGSEPATTPLRLVYFGFVWRGRHLEALVEALAAANAAVRAPRAGATLTIIGEVRDGAYAEELRALATARGVGDRLVFTGALPASEVSCYLSRAEVALLPFPTGASTGRTTLMAALEHGLPVVTTAVRENWDARFRPGDNLACAPAGDFAAFAAEAARVAADADLRRHLAEGAARLAPEFAWPKIAAATRAVWGAACR